MEASKNSGQLVGGTLQNVVGRNRYRVMVLPWCSLHEPQIKRWWLPIWLPLYTVCETPYSSGPLRFYSSEEAWAEIEKHKNPPPPERVRYEYTPNPTIHAHVTEGSV